MSKNIPCARRVSVLIRADYYFDECGETRKAAAQFIVE